MLWLAWLPVLAIGIAHYTTGSDHHWLHDIYRRLYYVPILFAAFTRGSHGGFAVALVVSLSYGPHAFLVGPPGHDPETAVNKVLEIVLYNTVGLLAGILADREARRRAQVERAYDEQRRMGEQLVRAGRLAALGELVAGIAHELKNPLHTIKGTAEIVDEVMPKDVEQASMWQLHRQEIDRLERIAERFLSFVRPSRVELAPVRLADLHARIAELLTARVKSAPGIRLELGVVDAAIAHRTVRVDRDQLAQAVLSIAGNALQAMQGRGELRLQVGLDEEAVSREAFIRLENDGPRLPEGDLERIFDPFFTRSDQGTGLGLPIAERIAEAHGGYVTAENLGPAWGVVFTVVLPVAS
jgi:signal transduction histidine kinase